MGYAGRYPVYVLFAVSPFILSTALWAQEWTRFRGPNGTGISKATTIPVRFTPAEYNWRVPLPGVGHSSPVIWGERLFLTSADEEKGKRYLLCLSAADGRRLWTRSYDFTAYSHHEFNTAASSTPVVDAERVYVVWTTHEQFTVLALDHNGKEVWKRDLGRFPTQHGGAASPILVGDILIVTMEPEDASGLLLGLDRKTGATRWQRPRSGGPAPYATPILYEPEDGPAEVIFVSTANGITGLDPMTGAVNWELSSLFNLRCVASPIQAGGLILVTAGQGGGARQAAAVQPGSKKAGTDARLAYKLPRGPSYIPTPIAVGDRVFFWGDSGIVMCVKASTGEQVWQERVGGGDYFGSPVCVDGKLYAMSAKGELAVIEASDRFKLLARNDLGEPSHATPAVSNGVMYLRTLSHLISVGGKKQVGK